MKLKEVDGGFISTIQHYQEALTCMELCNRYLRTGEHPSNAKLDASRGPGFPIGHPFGVKGTGSTSPAGVGGLDLVRPNAREPLRAYLSRTGASYSNFSSPSPTSDFGVLGELIDRCASAISDIQQELRTDNSLVKDSLQSLMESLKFQKRLLEKRKHKLQKKEDASCLLAEQQGPMPRGGDPVEDAVTAMRIAPEDRPSGGGLASVVGLKEIKEVIEEAFVLPAKFPHLFKGEALQSWSRILLYGPPGTGKTRLARALATDLRCPLYMVSPSLLLSSWLGDSEKIIRELFNRARAEDGPAIVFLDEVDAICRTRTQQEDDTTRRIKTELLVHLDDDCQSSVPYHHDEHADDNVFQFSDDFDSGINGSALASAPQNNKVFVIAATNCPWDVDSAFMRRFQKRCYVPLPLCSERVSLLQSCLSGCRTDLLVSDWDEVARATEGLSGADLSTMATAAAFRPIRELHSATFWCFTQDNKVMPCSNNTLGAMQYTIDKLPPYKVTTRPVQLHDLLSAAHSTACSVPHSLLQQYAEYQEL